jgi:hypothetical protein
MNCCCRQAAQISVTAAQCTQKQWESRARQAGKQASSTGKEIPNLSKSPSRDNDRTAVSVTPQRAQHALAAQQAQCTSQDPPLID